MFLFIFIFIRVYCLVLPLLFGCRVFIFDFRAKLLFILLHLEK